MAWIILYLLKYIRLISVFACASGAIRFPILQFIAAPALFGLFSATDSLIDKRTVLYMPEKYSKSYKKS